MIEATTDNPASVPQYTSAGLTHIGKLRATNQDSLARLDKVGLWVVADGMGGYRQGDVASRMVCESLLEVRASDSLEETIEQVSARLSDVNRRLYKTATRLINPIVSGTTVVALIASGGYCAVVWAGDSRLYRLREGAFTQITTDHTWAAELNLQNAGEEADHSITRAVGGEYMLSLDMRHGEVQRGDRYLLCSDGLTHEIDDRRIAELLARGSSDEAAQALITATLATSARDNVSVIVVDAH